MQIPLYIIISRYLARLAIANRHHHNSMVAWTSRGVKDEKAQRNNRKEFDRCYSARNNVHFQCKEVRIRIAICTMENATATKIFDIVELNV